MLEILAKRFLVRVLVRVVHTLCEIVDQLEENLFGEDERAPMPVKRDGQRDGQNRIDHLEY